MYSKSRGELVKFATKFRMHNLVRHLFHGNLILCFQTTVWPTSGLRPTLGGAVEEGQRGAGEDGEVCH